MGMRI